MLGEVVTEGGGELAIGLITYRAGRCGIECRHCIALGQCNGGWVGCIRGK
jgi:hypothetical protein